MSSASLHQCACFYEGIKDLPIQKLVTELAVERLQAPILPRTA